LLSESEFSAIPIGWVLLIGLLTRNESGVARSKAFQGYMS